MYANALVFVRWNGETHEVEALADNHDGATQVTIFRSRWPEGYEADSNVGQIDYNFGEDCLKPDPSGNLEYVCTQLLDLDEAQSWKKPS